MDLSALPFDSETMLAGLVACESPTFDVRAVNRMMDIASRDLILAGERDGGRMGISNGLAYRGKLMLAPV